MSAPDLSFDSDEVWAFHAQVDRLGLVLITLGKQPVAIRNEIVLAISKAIQDCTDAFYGEVLERNVEALRAR